jgi:prepilin signal peptidase PulO-like enzyme (type II secretory pathway)
MNTADCVQAEPVPTLDRVAQAWDRSSVLARLAWCTATAASLVIATDAGRPLWTTAAVGALLATAALVDATERRLPNSLSLAAGVLAMASAFVTGQVAAAIGGALIAGGLLLAVRLVRGLGMGDVKVAAVIGASVGSRALAAAPVAIAVAAFAAAGYGLLRNRSRVPLGPALWLGWACALVVPMGWSR